ncbi:MAG: NADH-quinone oxidoreductase subunit H [Chitinispirillaceae bacterium]|nr:NADH-quinone oxidoreductase subunit H [Chitinispirillaceae bacterium]
MVRYLVHIGEVLIFPGLLFTAVIGLVTSWIDRKVTARVQMRVGPPFLQPFYDIVKYMIKETCVPAGASKFVFLAAPLFGLAAVTVASTILWRPMVWPEKSFIGDLIVVLYLLTIPAVSVVIGSFASANPIASIGGSREMKLILSYELPFILACLVPVIKTGSIEFGRILAEPMAAASPAGIIALIVAIVCMQAKLTLVPFDMPEAETELTGGAYVEYSGPPLGIFKLTRAMMLFTMPVFLITVLWGGIPLHEGAVPAVLGAVKYVGLIVITVLIRNTAPRVRIDQAMKFFWGPVTLFGVIAVIVAFIEGL